MSYDRKVAQEERVEKEPSVYGPCLWGVFCGNSDSNFFGVNGI